MHVSRDGYLGLLPNDVHKLLTDLLYNQNDGFTFDLRRTHTIDMRCGRVALSLYFRETLVTGSAIARFIEYVSRGIGTTLLTGRTTCLVYSPFRFDEISIFRGSNHPSYRIHSLPLCKGLIDVLREVSDGLPP